MLNESLKAQLASALQKITVPIEVQASLDESKASIEMRNLLDTIGTLSEKIQVKFDGEDQRTPSFSIRRAGTDMGLRFAAIPLGHEFTSLVLALVWAGGHPPKVDPAILEQIRLIKGSYEFEVFMSLSCHNCPEVVQALSLMAITNPRIRTTIIDGGLYQQEISDRNILAVPMVYLNDKVLGSGRMSLEQIVNKLDEGADARSAAALNARDTFDLLVIGGGPAGAAAAIYAARKGLKTGIAAERFGGQTNDTLGIENYISIIETNGPKFSAALEAHAHTYDVDIMNHQRAHQLVPPEGPGGMIGVKLANGAHLSARSVVLATGARWRTVDVPGEQEYRNRGVAYCPHCDGPLFKGKRTAVIGGGNSGVEAAIDLAGVVSHVTLIEFSDRLKADAVLVSKLRSLPNVSVMTNTQTLEIMGNGKTVNGLRVRDRSTGIETSCQVEGVFVQIGLVPNTEWLSPTIELNRFGEIIVDAGGQTNVPGVFAAGDATTTPYKQIIIAAGDGAKAALSAFDYLIRVPIPQQSEAETEAANLLI